MVRAQTHDWKVTGLSPCRGSGSIIFSRVNFLCWLLFQYPFYPCVNAVARNRSQSFRQKCRWQVTAKHVCTLRMWLCMKWHSAWLYGEHRMCWGSSSFMWHQPCQRCKYTTSAEIQKHYKKPFIGIESHASAVSARERRIALYKSDQQQQQNQFNLKPLLGLVQIKVFSVTCCSRFSNPSATQVLLTFSMSRWSWKMVFNF